MCRLRVTLHSEFWNPLYKSWPLKLTEVLTSHASKHLVKWHAEHLHMFLCMRSVCLRLLLQIRRPSTNNRTIGMRKLKGSKSCHRAEKALSTHHFFLRQTLGFSMVSWCLPNGHMDIHCASQGAPTKLKFIFERVRLYRFHRCSIDTKCSVWTSSCRW